MVGWELAMGSVEKGAGLCTHGLFLNCCWCTGGLRSLYTTPNSSSMSLENPNDACPASHSFN